MDFEGPLQKSKYASVWITFDWVDVANGADILQSVWILPPGLISYDEAVLGTGAMILVGSGDYGEIYQIENQVTLSDNSRDSRFRWLEITYP